MTFKMGKLIRYLRKQKKMTQSELGQGIISESALSRIENGLSEPGLFTLDKLFWKLGKTLQPFEIVISNKEFEALKRKKDTLMANTVVIAESEYFKDIREGKGLSQEKFSSDVCARETISNIEHGRTPRLRKVQDVLEKQGMVFERYHGYICASSLMQ